LYAGFDLYIIKESNKNCLYISKESSVPLPKGYIIPEINLCNNRNNEIILFIHNSIKSEFGDMSIILSFDVLLGKTCKTFHQFNNTLGFDRDVFFNSTGEEIFVKQGNRLEIYVYKSKVRSLKQTCQILVWEQYSSEQLDRMNLPKYLLRSDKYIQ